MYSGAIALAVSLAFTVGNAFPQQAVPLNGTSSTVPQSATTLPDSTPLSISQATTAPTNSTPSSFPLTASASTCWTSCHLNGPDYQQWVWRPIKFTETITYAPVITVINTRRNTTRTVTNTIGPPGNYTPQLTNEAGTAICPITLFDNTTTTLTYPQEFGDYGTDYWLALTCPQTRRDVTLKSHPDFNEWFFTGTRTRLRQPGGFSTQSGVYDDVRGINWGCLTERDPVGELSAFLIEAFPDETAFPRCMHSVSVPVNFLTSAALLTVTSVSYEGDEDTTSEPTRSTVGDVPISTGIIDFPTTTALPGNPPEAPAPSTKAPTVLPPASQTTAQAQDPNETSVPEQPPGPPAPSSTAAETDVPGTTVQAPVPGETLVPEQPPVPPAPSSTAAEADVPETTVQAPVQDETSRPEQPPAAPAPSTVVGTVLPPASDTPVQVSGGIDETSQPVQNIPVGSTSVAVFPTVIPTTISGSSASVPAVVIGSTTLTAGQTAVIDNTPIVVPTANNPTSQLATQDIDSEQPPPAIIIGGGSTITLPAAVPPPATPEPPTLTLANGQTITPSGSAYIISGQTLAPDSPALTLGGGDGDADDSQATVIALTTNAAGSSIVLVGESSTIPYTNPATPTKPALFFAPAPPTLTLANGQTIVPSGSAYVISGATLTPGSPPLTLGGGGGGTVIALTTDAAGSRIVVVDGSSTVAYVTAATPAPPSSNAPPLVVFGTTVAPSGSGTYVFAGQTLTLGGTVTVGDDSGGSGAAGARTRLVMTTDEAGRTVVVVAQGGDGGASATTTASSSATTEEEEGIGGLIISGLGGGVETSSSSSSSSSSAAASSGSALPSSDSAAAAGGRRRAAYGELLAAVVVVLLGSLFM